MQLLLPLAPLLGEIPGTEEEMTEEERLQVLDLLHMFHSFPFLVVLTTKRKAVKDT